MRHKVGTYQGPATLKVDDKTISVDASLELWEALHEEEGESVAGPITWDGDITADESLLAWLGAAHIELPNGRTGDVIVTGVRGPGKGDIRGIGEPPFDRT